jgi:mono/diheme cytochrome c family protein
MSKSLVVCGLLTSLLLAGVARAADEGDAGKGRLLAEEKCARCHNIEKGAAFKLQPPSFQSIAIYRTRQDIWGRIISPSPHSGMPDMMWALTPDQVQDAVAYITSLDTPVTLPE